MRGWLALALGAVAMAWAAGPQLGGAIAGKSGPPNARIWVFQVGNSGPGDAVDARITDIGFVRTNGAACSPVIRGAMPLLAGSIPPQGTARVSVTIDFSGCDAGALFKVTATETANGGAVTGAIVRLNQFQ